ncbi:MAG: TetR/AcrR family transcriptional regulator [Baekduia sp.]|jgi:AcrR family transcriptional regulator
MAVLSRGAGSRDQPRDGEAAFVEATRDLLAEGASYADLSIGRIAERAERTRTAFYFYFRDKRDLLVKATDQIAAVLYDEADAWWSGDGGLADLRVALDNVLTTYRAHAPFLRAVVEAATYDDEVGRFWRELVGRFIEATERRLLADGRQPDEAHTQAFLLVWMTERACYQHVVNGGNLSDEALMDGLVGAWQRVGGLPKT